MTTKLTIGQRVHWLVRGQPYYGIVHQIKKGGWYVIQETKCGYLYTVRSRHVMVPA